MQAWLPSAGLFHNVYSYPQGEMIYLYIPHACMYRYIYIYIYIYIHWYTSRERNRKRDVSFGIQKPLTKYPYGGGGDVDHHWDTMIQADRCTALCMFPYIQHMSFTKEVMSSRQLCSQHAPFTNVMHCFFMSNPWVGPGSEGLGPRLQGLRSIHLAALLFVYASILHAHLHIPFWKWWIISNEVPDTMLSVPTRLHPSIPIMHRIGDLSNSTICVGHGRENMALFPPSHDPPNSCSSKKTFILTMCRRCEVAASISIWYLYIHCVSYVGIDGEVSSVIFVMFSHHEASQNPPF